MEDAMIGINVEDQNFNQAVQDWLGNRGYIYKYTKSKLNKTEIQFDGKSDD